MTDILVTCRISRLASSSQLSICVHFPENSSPHEYIALTQFVSTHAQHSFDFFSSARGGSLYGTKSDSMSSAARQSNIKDFFRPTSHYTLYRERGGRYIAIPHEKLFTLPYGSIRSTGDQPSTRGCLQAGMRRWRMLYRIWYISENTRAITVSPTIVEYCSIRQDRNRQRARPERCQSLSITDELKWKKIVFGSSTRENGKLITSIHRNARPSPLFEESHLIGSIMEAIAPEHAPHDSLLAHIQSVVACQQFMIYASSGDSPKLNIRELSKDVVDL